MLSKITIEVDFDNNNEPVLQIIYRESDDVRDKLIKSFYQKLGGDSNLCRIVFKERALRPDPSSDFLRIHISPLPFTGFNILDNSDGFRQFLDSRKIEWKPNGHCTTILSKDVSEFALGKDFQAYKDGLCVKQHAQ